jgi:hypothetical protein
MGGSQPIVKPISKLQIEIAAMKVREYLLLQKERKSNEAIKDEKQLLNLMNGEVRNRQEEYMLMEKIVGVLKYLNGKSKVIQLAEYWSATLRF